uniref:Uncharacterized protein n=1 Tax=Rhizophora mucronata TaxID=61149 RepID=A0A2P2L5E6_RHIMU
MLWPVQVDFLLSGRKLCYGVQDLHVVNRNQMDFHLQCVKGKIKLNLFHLI